ncbi:MAG: YceD family protein [Cyanobacteria bacterium P01_E01_bin.6]
MDKIYIPQILRAPDHTESLRVNQSVRGFQSLTPVQGNVTVAHGGQYLEVTASVETITTLTCDRCLQNYNHRLTVNASELIWLDHLPNVDEDMIDEDLIADDLVETIPSTGYFEPETWLYEYLCLSLPQQKLCDEDCAGIQLDTDNPSPEDAAIVDSRWGALAALKRQTHHLDV